MNGFASVLVTRFLLPYLRLSLRVYPFAGWLFGPSGLIFELYLTAIWSVAVEYFHGCLRWVEKARAYFCRQIPNILELDEWMSGCVNL